MQIEKIPVRGISWVIPRGTEVKAVLVTRGVHVYCSKVDWTHDRKETWYGHPITVENLRDFQRWILNVLDSNNENIIKLCPSKEEVLSYEKENFHMKITPNGSCGHMYLCAWIV